MTTPATLLAVSLAADVAPALIGPPGVGKTSLLAATAASRGWNHAVLELAQCDPTDLAGVPVYLNGRVARVPLGILAELADNDAESLLVLDDLTAAAPTVQAAALRLLLQRRAGDLHLPPRVHVAVAFNPAGEGGLFSIEPAVAGRLAHIEMAIDPHTVARGFTIGWPTPSTLQPPDQADIDRWRRNVAGFVIRRPSLTNVLSTGGPSPTPRTWEMAARLAATSEANGLPRAVTHGAIASVVGEGATAEFVAWTETLDLPDPAELLCNPYSAEFADVGRPDRTFLVATSVVDTAVTDGSVAMWKAAWTVLATALAAGQGDIVLVAATRLAEARPHGEPLPAAAVELLVLLDPEMAA